MPLVLPAFLQQSRTSSTSSALPPARARVHRRLRIRTEKDGLLVYALNAKQAARLRWGKADTVERVEDWTAEPSAEEQEVEVEGLIGVLRLFQHSWVLAIAKSSYAATLPSTEQHPVRSLTDILAVPLDAGRAPHIIREHAHKVSQATTSDFTDTDISDADETPLRSMAAVAAQPVAPIKLKREKGYGLGAFLWRGRPTTSRQQTFSALGHEDPTPQEESTGSLAENRPGQAMASLQDIAKAASITTVDQPSLEEPPASDLIARAQNDAASRERLDNKIVREVVRELRHGFYFSYDADITRNLQYKTARPRKEGTEVLSEPDGDVPLCSRADPRFFYNRWMSRPLIKAGLIDYILPLMQGFVKQDSATLIPSDGSTPLEVTLTVISRRSIERPGLRYQRRGVNANGQTANFVESEFLVEVDRPEGVEADRQISSFVQTRGSIPLHWSQSPWSLKPVPVLERSEEENQDAIGKHFDAQTSQYGKQTIVNLVEHGAREGAMRTAYKSAVEKLQREDVKYTEFDFHHECKGMRFENVSRLVEQVQPDMEKMDFNWVGPSQIFTKQNGVFRTNCMDCLDRTNVVQSALARKQLSTFLTREGFASTVSEKLEVMFNELWASNGDAISLEYAGTSALKGDFVRSGKRNWRGVFNDATNSLSRMWQNTIADFFKQSMIDYILGIDLGAFEEFSSKVSTTDPGKLLHLATIRSTAVETASASVLADGEKRVHGWTLLSPSEAGQRTAASYEERVVLLSDKALYSASYEYSLQKVREFVRIPLGDVVGISYGPYILSTLSSFARDTTENYGLAIRFLPSSASSRAAAYSLRNRSSTLSLTASTPSSESSPPTPGSSEPPAELAFKAMRRDLVSAGAHTRETSEEIPSGEEATMAIVKMLHRACIDAGAAEEDGGDGFVKREDIVSLEQAEHATGFLARLRYKVEHAIWL